MNIPENFDRWMFDYKEGNLSGAELQEFENFLIQHPEFEADADVWSHAFVQNENVVYRDAKKLMKRAWYADSYKAAAALLLLLLIGGSSVLVFYPGSKDNNASITPNGDGTSFSQNSTRDQSALASAIAAYTGTTSQSPQLVADLHNGLNGQNHLAANVQHLIGQPNGNNNPNGSNQGNSRLVDTYSASSPANQSASFAEGGSFDQEQAKFSSEDNSSRYLNNPVGTALNFDLNKKTSVNYHSLRNRIKRVYRKVERVFGYPVALKNLRDPELVLPQSNLLAFNPGFAGGALSPRAEMNYRNQWWGSPMNSQSMNVSFDNYSYGLRGGYGVLISAQDYKQGAYDDINVSLFYSPKIMLGKNIVLEPAVKMTMGTLSMNAEKTTAFDAIEMNRGRNIDLNGSDFATGTGRLWYKDFGLGLMLNSKRFFAGFSADNINRHSENVFTVDGSAPKGTPIRLNAIVGSDYENRTETMTFSPFVAYEKYDTRSELWGGFNYRLNWITVGGSLSTSKSFSATAGVKFEKFKLVYRYDRTQSMLMASPIGSHNIGIRITGEKMRLRK